MMLLRVLMAPPKQTKTPPHEGESLITARLIGEKMPLAPERLTYGELLGFTPQIRVSPGKKC